MTWAIVAIAVLAAVLAIFGAWAYRTANRLDRLHVRYDLSWQALDGALADTGGPTVFVASRSFFSCVTSAVRWRSLSSVVMTLSSDFSSSA